MKIENHNFLIDVALFTNRKNLEVTITKKSTGETEQNVFVLWSPGLKNPSDVFSNKECLQIEDLIHESILNLIQENILC